MEERNATHMKIERIIGGNIEANGYIIRCDRGADAYVIDPGFSHKKYLSFVAENGLRVRGILLTHHHYDHTDKAEILSGEWSCPVCLHREDVPYYRGTVDTALEGGETFPFGDGELRVLHTPGHTGGGVCFCAEGSNAAFTGDTVFNVDLGRTDLAGGSAARLKDSLISVVDKWRNDVTIHPGHGDPCTMKYVRENNSEYIEMVAR
jgi:glyoxylase-like metal-dependent hydrolase (beta-lactamase superfamily II)